MPCELLSSHGVIAYFTTTRASCGLYWCSQKKLVTRSDDTKSDSNSEYQHVSVLFRSSLLLQVTIFDHLIGTHWIISDGLLLASERHLDADHPIRRLIKPHTYGAGQVNLLSTALLAPVGGFAHRAFGFDAAAYPVALCDLISLWKCETYEEHFINSGLPSDMHDSLPLYRDGLDYWNVTEKYVRSYVDIYYPSEEQVTEDAQLQDYWADFKTQLPKQTTDCRRYFRRKR